MSRLLRTLHTTARAADAIATASTSTPLAPALASASKRVPTFTDKGRPIPVRPPRTTRVTLASGYPEPESYPPADSYFAEIAEIEKNLPANQDKPKPHPLWAFFHVPAPAARKLERGASMPDQGSMERLDDEDSSLASGRAWTAAELRQKSFEDLHTLWYVLLRERNVLATQREERRRYGIPGGYGGELLTKRAFRCRKSMARIKYVLNERRLALIAAAGPSAAASRASELAELGIEVGVEELSEGVPQVPFSALNLNDPVAAVGAIAGAVPVPDVKAMVGRVQQDGGLLEEAEVEQVEEGQEKKE